MKYSPHPTRSSRSQPYVKSAGQLSSSSSASSSSHCLTRQDTVILEGSLTPPSSGQMSSTVCLIGTSIVLLISVFTQVSSVTPTVDKGARSPSFHTATETFSKSSFASPALRRPKANLGRTTTLGDSEGKGRIGLDCLSVNPKRARMGSLLVLDCTLYILEYMRAARGYS